MTDAPKSWAAQIVEGQQQRAARRPCLNPDVRSVPRHKPDGTFFGAVIRCRTCGWRGHCGKCGVGMQFADGVCFDCNGGRDPGD